MLTADPGDIEAALLPLIPQLATRVPDDILSGLVAARETETGARARIVLDQLVQNACVAADDWRTDLSRHGYGMGMLGSRP